MMKAKKNGSLPIWKSFTRKDLLSFAAAIVISVIALYLFSRLPPMQNFGYAGIFIISLISSATIFLPLPGFAVVFGSGAVLNPFFVGIAAGIGSGLGEITGYLAGYAGHDAVMGTRAYKAHRAQIEKGGPPAIFALALLPNPLFDLAGIASGAIKMPAWKFLIATICGKTVRYVALAYVGSFAGGWLQLG